MCFFSVRVTNKVFTISGFSFSSLIISCFSYRLASLYSTLVHCSGLCSSYVLCPANVYIICHTMAVTLSSESQKRHRSFTTVLASALLEWMLIFMLLVYGLFGYLITKFARYCELPLPCLLCSRIDHILRSEKSGFYWDMICGNHKLEVSSLVYCHFHERLVDVRGMCESCLFSFATKNKSNAETYRLLVGKLGGEDLSGFDNEPVTKDHKNKGLDMKHCCCCNELFTSRQHAQTLLQTKSSGFGSNLDLPLSREFSQDFNDLEKEVKSSNPLADIGMKNENSLVQFGYSELKVTSDTESDNHMSDAEDMRPLISSDPLRDLILDSALVKPFIAVSEDESACGNIQDVLSSKPSEMLHAVQAEIINLHDTPSVVPASAIGHGLEELDWQEIDINLEPSASTSLMTFNSVSDLPNDGNVTVHSSKDRSNIEVGIVPEKVHIKDLKELDINESGIVMEKMDVKDANNLDIKEAKVVKEKVDAKDLQKMGVKEAGVVQTLEQKSEKSQDQTSADLNNMNMNMNMKSEHKERGLQIPGLQVPNYMDLGDAYNLAINGKSRQLSGKLAEQLAGKESPTVNPDLKLLLSHLSKGSEFLSSDILSPGLSKSVDELKANNDSPTSIGMKILQKRISLERNDSKSSLDRNESGFESLDFSSVSEIEGESEIDRLKRQLEHDRKFLIALLKDLEEERNASSIAANETMAMITRLQEEKAALQMEASHDLRMMEEQAEYDLEALDKLNEIVIEKEKKIQDLEADLEYYTTKYQNDSNMENDGGSASNACLSGTDDLNSLAEDTKIKSKYPLLEIENERKHLSECLNNLEKKLSAFCCNKIHPDWKHRDLTEEQGKDSSCDLKFPEEDKKVKSDCVENGLSSDKVGLVSTGSHKTLLRHDYSFKRSKSAGAEQTALILKEADIADLLNEVSSLSMKLQAIESDQSFIERSINTLKNGEGGLIQEIASHLRELRKIGVRRHDERNPVER